MARRGTFIVIEGTDGSGKGTQFQLLRDRLKMAGYQVETFDFPQYDQPSSYFAQQYLNGEYGSANEIGPYTASLFYALDRYEAASKIREALDKGKIVLSNRFTGSSMGHQGGKFRSAEERRGYFIWLDNLEFEMLRIPRPDVSFVLRVPAAIAQELIDKKGARTYTDKKRDIHEADIKHLERSVVAYDDLCQLFPKDFQRIDCVRKDKMLDVETIQHMLWEKISPLLPTPSQIEMPMQASKTGASAPPATPEQPQVRGDNNKAPVPDPQKNGEKEYITNRKGPVYAFTNALQPQLIAAVMTTLSRSSGVLSTAVLKAFGEAARKDATFLKRVLDTYADETVRQVIHQQVVVTGASALLAKKLEWGRTATYTRPKVQYLRPEQKDANGEYKYFTPPGLIEIAAKKYKEYMDYIFESYELMLSQLTTYLKDNNPTPQAGRNADWEAAIDAEARTALYGVVPTAHTATIGVYASAEAFEKLIIRLLGDELPEAQQTGEQILLELRKTIPAFMENTDRPDRGGAEVVYRADVRRDIELFAKENIVEQYAPETDRVQLTDVWPRNELDIVPDMLYAKTNLPLSTLRGMVNKWSYDQRLTAFLAYVGDRLNRCELPGRALEKARYSWDIVSPFSVFRDLQRQNVVDDLEWQMLTPRAGYEVPQLIEEADLADQYEECFDLSLRLNSLLQQGGYELEAQYATLAGHRVRWKFTLNGRQTIRFMEQYTTQRTVPETRWLVEKMHERLANVHPLMAEAMVFVGQPEDPELDQLAAERYKQSKVAPS
jgi:dTMP kinase